ncbi:uncharacterized protein BJX67DRAFT_373960 [Aspergillus lucknowensis]|uniref:Streptococcal 67 kDa myosin-cross-reactive antigen like family-domain-containing protein n=1 Tax=Aspergillus lucknowensis TaxID=176173 RepID=A0ABR4LIF1_9EURO
MSRCRRNPQITHAWIIGADISSLAAAVYLIHDARVPGPHVHIIANDCHPINEIEKNGCLAKAANSGLEFVSCIIDRCTKQLLSCVSGSTRLHGYVLGKIMNTKNGTDRKSFYFLKHGERGIRKLQQPLTQLRLADRKDVLKVMLDEEKNLDSKSIEDCFKGSFIQSDLWQLFSKRFALQPWHSATEFQRCLRKYLEEAQYSRVDQPAAAQYIMESLQATVRDYLRKEGVNFWPRTLVSDLKLLTENSSTNVSMIEGTQNGKSFRIPITREDIVLVALGSTISGSLAGSNGAPPPPIPVRADWIMNNSWSLWFKLAQISPEFGNPAAFCTHLSESKVEAFTVTLPGDGPNLYSYLAEQIGEGSSLIIPNSSWSLCLYLPSHPLGSEERTEVHNICGYGLTPEKFGNFIKKPMCCCAGQEILSELLSHLGRGFDECLSTAITIPLLMPLASAALMRRNRDDRPHNIPQHTKNIGFIGAFSEIADETVCGLEYCVRSAQIAVYGLMSLHQSLPNVKINAVAERYGKRNDCMA